MKLADILRTETRKKKNRKVMLFGIRSSYIRLLTGAVVVMGGIAAANGGEDPTLDINVRQQAHEPDLTRQMVVGTAESSPSIDGLLDDPSWEAAAKGTFRSLRSLEEWSRIGWTVIPTPQLGGMGTIYATWGERNLYLGFRAEKQVGHRNVPPPPKIEQRNSKELFEDDAVHIYLQPEENGKIFKILVNANGAVWDAVLSSDGGWDSSWEAGGIEAAGRDKPGSYEVELSIPFDDLGVETPEAGAEWRVNFARNELPSGEETAWSYTGEFADPDSFGILRFAGNSAAHTVAGRVVTESPVGEGAVALAGVFVQSPAGMFRTDESGRFDIPVTAPGPMVLYVGSFEYAPVVVEFEIEGKREVVPDIELEKRREGHARIVHPDVNRVMLSENPYIPNPGFEYAPIHRRYQSCPKGVAVLDCGKVVVTYTAFGRGERRGNMVVIESSTDGAETWEPEVVVSDGQRVAWGNFFHDPRGRLWMFTNPPVRVHLSRNPGESPMEWEDRGLLDPDLNPLALGENAPIALSDGTYLYTLARTERETEWLDVYASTDEGANWYLRGSAWVPPEGRAHQEPMVVERKDGSLWMLSRTHFPDLVIGESVSHDQGRTWTDVEPTNLDHTNARFYIGRLHSGRLLLIKHADEAVKGVDKWEGREDLTAYLSEDDGETWPYKLLIQDGACSYPDAAQDKDGRIYIAYDVGRHGEGAEIRMAVVTEEDIISGELAGEDSRRGIVISRTGPDPESSREFAPAWDGPVQKTPLER